MEKELMKTEDVLCGLIEGRKLIGKTFERVGRPLHEDAFTAFNREVEQFYWYIHSHTRGSDKDISTFYTLDRFMELFYCSVTDGKELPANVLEWASSYLKGLCCQTDNKEVLNVIADRIVKLRIANAFRECVREGYREETEEIRELLYNHVHCKGYMGILHPLIMWARSYNKLNIDFVYAVFQYGYIRGKRAERNRRRVTRTTG